MTEANEGTRIDFLTKAVLNHLGEYSIKGVLVRQDVTNLAIETRLLQTENLSLRDQLSRERELQADKANEGREEKEIKHYIDEARKILSDGDIEWIVQKIADLVQKDDQLSKERENFDKMHRASLATLNELQKEREMRKELVVVSGEMKKIYSKYAHDDPYEDHVFEYLESLIAKATELDKK